MKRFLRGLLRPAGWVAAVCALCSAGVLVWVFARGLNDTPLAYAAYALSAWSLAVLIPYAVRAVRGLKAALMRRPRYLRTRQDPAYRAMLSLALSLAVNLAYALFKAVVCAFTGSAWVGLFAVYYLMLFLLRLYLLRAGQGKGDEWRALGICGASLMLLTLVVSGLGVLMIRRGASPSYPGVTIFAAAAYTFYAVFAAARNLVIYGRLKEPVPLAARGVGMAAALVSLFTLESAMLQRFGGGEQAAAFARTMTALTGGGVTLLIVLLSAGMLLAAHRHASHNAV